MDARSHFKNLLSGSARHQTPVTDSDGQSILEFLLMLPIFMALGGLLLKMSAATQVSITNQVHARSQAHYLTFNSPHYPTLGTKRLQGESGSDQFVVGVDQELVTEGEKVVPTATQVRITRAAATEKGSKAAQEEPKLRGDIRVRTTVALCTERTYAGNVPLESATMSEEYFAQHSYCVDKGTYE